MEIKEIKKVVFQKGDVLILRYSGVLSSDACNNLKESCETVLDKVGLRNDVAIMVLEENMDISVLTQKDINDNWKTPLKLNRGNNGL